MKSNENFGFFCYLFDYFRIKVAIALMVNCPQTPSHTHEVKILEKHLHRDKMLP